MRRYLQKSRCTLFTTNFLYSNKRRATVNVTVEEKKSLRNEISHDSTCVFFLLSRTNLDFTPLLKKKLFTDKNYISLV